MPRSWLACVGAQDSSCRTFEVVGSTPNPWISFGRRFCRINAALLASKTVRLNSPRLLANVRRQCEEVGLRPGRGGRTVQVMADSYIQDLFAERIGGRQYGKSTAIYKFEKIKRAKRAAIAAHPGQEIIDLGVGEPDEMAFPEVVAQLHAEALKPENRGYADNGDALLKEAAARYLDRVCGVQGIQPDTEILHSIGSKAALSILPAALINPGD